MVANYYVETLLVLPKKSYGRVFIGPIDFSAGLELARKLARLGDRPKVGWYKPNNDDVVLETGKVEPLIMSESGPMDLRSFRISSRI